MARQKYMIGNWKMNQTLQELQDFFTTFSSAPQDFKCNLGIAPQFPHLDRAIQDAKKINNLLIGAQNCSDQNSGALTGEVSPLTLKELGCHFTIIGHSERRSIFCESDELLRRKTILALENNLQVIFCVGESLEDRESGNTMDIVLNQLNQGLKDIEQSLLKNIIIAYEPVWAIGTGKTATPEQAEEVHLAIRINLDTLNMKGEETSILYGGSVRPENVEDLLSCPNIDGGLVGGASLKASSFLKLCQAFK